MTIFEIPGQASVTLPQTGNLFNIFLCYTAFNADTIDAAFIAFSLHAQWHMCLHIYYYMFRVLNCSSQPSMVHWLSSSIFPCSFVRPSVRPAMVTSDQISTFFNIYWHKSHIITQYHIIPSSTKLN